jgi:hypothetical protein
MIRSFSFDTITTTTVVTCVGHCRSSRPTPPCRCPVALQGSAPHGTPRIEGRVQSVKSPEANNPRNACMATVHRYHCHTGTTGAQTRRPSRTGEAPCHLALTRSLSPAIDRNALASSWRGLLSDAPLLSSCNGLHESCEVDRFEGSAAIATARLCTRTRVLSLHYLVRTARDARRQYNVRQVFEPLITCSLSRQHTQIRSAWRVVSHIARNNVRKPPIQLLRGSYSH